jgi:hypothetical protein
MIFGLFEWAVDRVRDWAMDYPMWVAAVFFWLYMHARLS